MKYIWYVCDYYLYSRLIEFGRPSEFFPAVDIRIVWLGEGSFQLGQLFLQSSNNIDNTF